MTRAPTDSTFDCREANTESMALPSRFEQACCHACCACTTPSIALRTDGSGTERWGYPACCCTRPGPRPVKRRTTSLTYARDGDNYLIVASKGGDPRAPGWYHNLRAHPDAADQRRTQTLRRHRPPGLARRPGLRPAVANRQRQQRQIGTPPTRRRRRGRSRSWCSTPQSSAERRGRCGDSGCVARQVDVRRA